MTFLVIALLAVGGFLILRRVKPSRKREGAMVANLGIPMTAEDIELERQSGDEIMKLLEANVVRSGFFKKERIPELIAGLKGGSVPFGRVNTKVIFDGDMLLTVEEKRSLGLNTRMKYSRKLIEYFEPASFKEIEPKAILECMHLDAFHRVSRKKEILRFKTLGFIKQVKIQAGDCGKIKRMRKIYPIDQVPELPLSNCDAPFCVCWYEPVLPKDL